MTTLSTSKTDLLLALAKLPHALGLTISVFFLAFGLALAAPYLSLFGINEVKMMPLQLGLFLTLNAIGAVLISLRLARWSDRSNNRKPLVMLTLAAGALAYLTFSFVRSYWGVLGAGFILLGTGSAAFPQLFSFARAQFNDAAGDLPQRALTVLRSVFSLAWVLGPALGAIALSRLGFKGTFQLAAVCFVVAMLPLISIKAIPPKPALSTLNNQSGDQSGAPATPARPMFWVVVAFVLYGMSLSVSMSMFPLFVIKTLHGSNEQVGFLVGWCALLEIPVMLGLVMWRRLPSVEWLIKAGMGLFVIHFLLIYVAHGTPLLLITQAIRAVVLGLLAGLGMAYFQQLMPGRFSAATTMFANSASIGSMLAGIVSGGWAQAFGYRSVFLLGAGLTFAGWLVMQIITRDKITKS